MTPAWVPIVAALLGLAGVLWTQRRADRRLERELVRADKRAVREAERADNRSKLEAELRAHEARNTAQDERLFAIYVDLLTVASQIGGHTVDELDTDGAWDKANRAFMQPAMRARVLAPKTVNDAGEAFSDALTKMRPISEMGHAELADGLAKIGAAVKDLQRAIRAELGLPDLEHQPSPDTLDLSVLKGDS